MGLVWLWRKLSPTATSCKTPTCKSNGIGKWSLSTAVSVLSIHSITIERTLDPGSKTKPSTWMILGWRIFCRSCISLSWCFQMIDDWFVITFSWNTLTTHDRHFHSALYTTAYDPLPISLSKFTLTPFKTSSFLSNLLTRLWVCARKIRVSLWI